MRAYPTRGAVETAKTTAPKATTNTEREERVGVEPEVLHTDTHAQNRNKNKRPPLTCTFLDTTTRHAYKGTQRASELVLNSAAWEAGRGEGAELRLQRVRMRNEYEEKRHAPHDLSSFTVSPSRTQRTAPTAMSRTYARRHMRPETATARYQGARERGTACRRQTTHTHKEHRCNDAPPFVFPLYIRQAST